MPELPEVETIVRGLRNGTRGGASILGNELQDARILWHRTLAAPSLAVFNQRIPGQTVRDLGRRGKYIVITLDQDTLLIHLRMSGDLRVEPVYNNLGQVRPLLKHDRAVFNFVEGQRLVFINSRKFGRVWLLDDPQSVLGKLGPEPLSADFSSQILFRRLQSHRRQLKPLLMDQTFLAGLGNIYTDEALYLSGLHPLLSSDQLTRKDAQRLWQSIREVLTEGIRRNGASIDWVYRGGDFQNTFQVYGRTGETCTKCGGSIERIIVGQRSTHFCPVCQPFEKP